MIRKAQDCKMRTADNRYGGQGEIVFTDLVTPEELAPHAKLCSVLSLAPGVSLGEHAHEDNFEVYYIMKGKGIVTEKEGETEVGPGDVIYTTHGASHAIRNEGEEVLEFLAVIVNN